MTTLPEEVDKRLFCPGTRLRSEDIDLLWDLFWASGEAKYALKVRSVISLKNQRPFVRRKAQQSYLSHVRAGYLYDSEYLFS